MEDYAIRLQQAINLGPLNFQTFICQNYLNPHSSKVLADYISADFQQSKKLLAVTGVNLLNKQRLRLKPENINEFWNQFKIDFIFKEELEWKPINILIKSLQCYKVQFAERFNKYFVQIFAKLSLKWKIVIFKCLIQRQQMSLQVYLVFFRQTIQLFFSEGLNFIYQSHQNYLNISHEAILIENQFLKILFEALDFIQIQQDQLFIQLKQKLVVNQMILQIVLEELLFNPAAQNLITFKKLKQQQSFKIQNLGPLLYLRYFKSQDFQQINQNKMNAFSIFQCIIRQMNIYSTAQQFDNSKSLLTLQQLTPKVIQQLIQIVRSLNFNNNVRQFSGTIKSMLSFLSTASKFIFLYQTFKNFHQDILFVVLPNFLKADSEEIEKYNTSPKQFITLNNIALEDDLQKISKINTVKEAGVMLLKNYFQAIQGSSLQIVNVILDTIQYRIQSTQLPQNLKILFDFGFNPNLQVCIFILTCVFIESQKQQNQIHHLILNKFILRQYHLRFEGVDKSRFISFLLYCFDYYFKNRVIDEVKLVEYVYSTMINTQEKTMFLYSLQFMQLRIKKMDSEIMKIIWQKIVNQIKITQHHQLISIVQKIVRQKLFQMSLHTVKNLLQIVFQRINSQYQRQIDPKGTHILFKCLSIIQQISQNEKYISKQPQVIQLIWPLFQFLKRSQSIQYQDNVIKIFNNLLTIQDKINIKYYEFLPCFQNITRKYRIFDQLLQTYFLLISKGQALFLSTLSQDIDLCNVIRFNIQQNIFEERTQNYVPSYVLLQFLLILYPHVVKQNPDFYKRTLQLYNSRAIFQQKQNLSAALVNYLIAYHLTFDKGELSIIQQNRIQIFKGTFGKLFAINIVKLIQRYAKEEFVINFLKYSLRLLHFLRQKASKQIQKKGKEKLFYKVTSKYIVSDPFLIIQESFFELKTKIGKQRFQDYMSLLQKQLPLSEIKELLMYKQINKSTRQIAKIKKRD